MYDILVAFYAPGEIIMSLGFHAKLFTVTITIVLVTIVILTMTQAQLARQGYREKGKAALDGVSMTLEQAFALQNEQSLKKIRADLDTLLTQFELGGFLIPEVFMDVPITLREANGTNGPEVILAGFKHSGHYLHENSDLVGRVATQTGTVSTVLQRAQDRMIRISTSGQESVPGWGQGSYLAAADPITATLLRGECYEGRLRFGSVWYQVALSPVRDLSNEVIGALEVARPLISDEVAAFTRNVRVSEGGGSFVVDGALRLLTAGPEGMLGHDASFVRQLAGAGPRDVTLADGQLVEMVVRHFAPWDIYFVTWVNDDDLMRGVTEQLTHAALMSAGLPLILSLILIWITGRQLMAPIHRLADLAQRVAGGDFRFNVDYVANDALGQTISALKRMVEDLKHKLGFGKGVLEGVVVPCVIVDTENRIVHVNRAVLKILGHDGKAERYLGMVLGEFVYGDADRRTLTQSAMETGEQMEQEILLHSHKDKGESHLRVVATPIHDLDERLIGAMALWVDLTEEKIKQARIEVQHQAMATAAMEAEDVSRRVTAAAADLAERILESSRGAEHQQDRAVQAAEAMERMSVSLGDVAANAASSTDLARQAVEQAGHGNAVVRESMKIMADAAVQTGSLREDLARLGETASSIGVIMDMVGDIADQTNLLALNAAIEAARAGAAGRGFAVVADEVRKLAEKTMGATRQVEDIVRRIQVGVRDSVRLAEETNASMNRCSDMVDESGVALTSIVETIGATAARIQDIAHAVALQRHSGERVLEATDEMATIARHNAATMESSRQAIQDMTALAQELLSAIASMRLGSSTPSTVV